MKKFLAILLASVMTLALAVPAMADTTTPVTRIDASVVAYDGEFLYNVEKYGITYTANPEGSVYVESISWERYLTATQTLDNAEPCSNSENAYDDYTYICKILFKGAQGYEITDDTDLYVDGVYSSDGDATNELHAEISIVPKAITKIDRVDLTFKPVIGEKVLSAAPTVDSVTPSGCQVTTEAEDWFKIPSNESIDDYMDDGTLTDLSILITDENEVFQDGYKYYCAISIYRTPNDGYKFTQDGTEVYLNGALEDFVQNERHHMYYNKGDICFIEVVPVAAGAEETTTAAATTTAATTAATTSTATKTGDSMSPMFFIIAMIAVAAAGVVTVFVARKKK